jgi:hypothetical protein
LVRNIAIGAATLGVGWASTRQCACESVQQQADIFTLFLNSLDGLASTGVGDGLGALHATESSSLGALDLNPSGVSDLSRSEWQSTLLDLVFQLTAGTATGVTLT